MTPIRKELLEPLARQRAAHVASLTHLIRSARSGHDILQCKRAIERAFGDGEGIISPHARDELFATLDAWCKVLKGKRDASTLARLIRQAGDGHDLYSCRRAIERSYGEGDGTLSPEERGALKKAVDERQKTLWFKKLATEKKSRAAEKAAKRAAKAKRSAPGLPNRPKPKKKKKLKSLFDILYPGERDKK